MAKQRKKKKYDRQLLLEKYDRICKEFKKMSAVKQHDVSKYSYEYILNHIGRTKFFLNPDTIAKIVREEPLEGYLSNNKK
jgi:hypothetical protein